MTVSSIRQGQFIQEIWSAICKTLYGVTRIFVFGRHILKSRIGNSDKRD